MEEIKKYIRSVQNFPKDGVVFYDITTLMQDPAGFELALNGMQAYVESRKPDKILAVESRGFLFGAVLADRLDLPLVPARKPGKLPFTTITEEYALEYGTDSLELHADAVSEGERVVIVDDLIATGGTLAACCKLVERLGGVVAGISSVIGLTFLPYASALEGYDYNYLVTYDSE